MTSCYRRIEVNTRSSATGRWAGYVYIVKFGEEYKIGRTKHPDSRIYEIQITRKCSFDEVHIIPADDCRIAEIKLHRKFKSQRVRPGKRAKYEWFYLTPEQCQILSRIGVFYQGQFYTHTEIEALQFNHR